jgi:hypothetical protein
VDRDGDRHQGYILIMTAIYELAALGVPSHAQLHALEDVLRPAIEAFGLRLGEEVAWSVRPEVFEPRSRSSGAAVFFGGDGASAMNVGPLLSRAVPVLPVVSSIASVHDDLPEQLRPFNCLDYSQVGPNRVATALLECAGLLPRQRRVFLSYRRDEARQAALQLFDALSARLFEVFLDTHGIAPAEDFQTTLWHRLCDSDVLVMLDTPTYFDSRWTSAEFGRALSKGIAVLQVAWPDSTPSPRTSTTSRAELIEAEVDAVSGRLADAAVDRICMQVEIARSEGLAVRHVNMVGRLRNELETIRGEFQGVGPHKCVHLRLADGRGVVVYPNIGVPTSITLHDAVTHAGGGRPAVVYDHVGLHPSWLKHLDWLGEQVQTARWIKASEFGWQLADWVA